MPWRGSWRSECERNFRRREEKDINCILTDQRPLCVGAGWAYLRAGLFDIIHHYQISQEDNCCGGKNGLHDHPSAQQWNILALWPTDADDWGKVHLPRTSSRSPQLLWSIFWAQVWGISKSSRLLYVNYASWKCSKSSTLPKIFSRIW